MKNLIVLAAILSSLLAGLTAVSASELTAFKLITEANRYVGEQARDKVVSMHSEKSIGGLTPSVWHVAFYDSTAAFKTTKVKFGGGTMMDVSRPMNLLEPFTGPPVPLNREQLKIDSDQALQIALEEPLLKRVTVKASALELKTAKADGVVWIVELWAAKVGHSDMNAYLGEVKISATDGKVIKLDLHIDRVN